MSLPHLILGALAGRAMTGYDLNKRFQSSIAHFWSTDQSQIYRALQKLKGRGFVEDEQVLQEGSPNKKLYHLTESGKDELGRWLRSPVEDQDEPIREGWLGQLFFGSLGDTEKTIDLLKGYLRESEEIVAELESIRDRVFGGLDKDHMDKETFLRSASVEYGITLRGAARDWIRRFIEELEKRKEP